MSQSIITQGEHRALKYTAAGTLAIGDVLLLGTTAKTAYVVDAPAVSGEELTVLCGPMIAKLASNTSDAFAFGGEVWWDDSADECVNAKGVGNFYIGTCVDSAGVLAATATMQVRMTGDAHLDNVDN
jgi:hypothetical protein